MLRSLIRTHTYIRAEKRGRTGCVGFEKSAKMLIREYRLRAIRRRGKSKERASCFPFTREKREGEVRRLVNGEWRGRGMGFVERDVWKGSRVYGCVLSDDLSWGFEVFIGTWCRPTNRGLDAESSLILWLCLWCIVNMISSLFRGSRRVTIIAVFSWGFYNNLRDCRDAVFHKIEMWIKLTNVIRLKSRRYNKDASTNNGLLCTRNHILTIRQLFVCEHYKKIQLNKHTPSSNPLKNGKTQIHLRSSTPIKPQPTSYTLKPLITTRKRSLFYSLHAPPLASWSPVACALAAGFWQDVIFGDRVRERLPLLIRVSNDGF